MSVIDDILAISIFGGIFIGFGAGVGIPKVWNILKPKLKDYINKQKKLK